MEQKSIMITALYAIFRRKSNQIIVTSQADKNRKCASLTSPFRISRKIQNRAQELYACALAL